MTEAHIHEVKKEVKAYILVFVALAALTIITVAVKYLHLKMAAGITVALCIATIKGSLVACYFMHLISEKKLIYSVLIFTAIFFAALALLLLYGHHNIQTGVQFVP